MKEQRKHRSVRPLHQATQYARKKQTTQQTTQQTRSRQHADHTASMSLMDFAGTMVAHSESNSTVDVEGGHADMRSSPAEEQRQEEEEHEQQQE